jgi:glycerophosphoryl diester phosphodiesterase
VTGNPWIRPDDPLIIAHRGQPAEAPEQTLESFTLAIERGAEMIEADVQLTRDGVLAMMHDPTVDRTTDGHGRPADHTWAELQALDAGGWFGPTYAGVRIPSAADTIELARARGVRLCLEVKGRPGREANAIAVALARLIGTAGATSFAFMSSFHPAALAAARAEEPALLIAPERLPEHGPRSTAVVVRHAVGLRADVLQHRWELLTAEVVDALHEADVAVWAWNTNDRRAIAVARALGVDGLITDDLRLFA